MRKYSETYGATLAALMGLLGSLMLLTNCGGGGDTTTRPRPEMPQTVNYDTVKLTYGQDDGVDRGRQYLRRQPMIGESSEVASLTRETVFGTNQSLVVAFDLMERARDEQPNRPSDDVWLWQTTTSRGALELKVTQTGADQYRHELSVGSGLDSLQVAVSGFFESLAEASDIQQGEGLLRFDFGALSEYGVTDSQGKARISFRRNGGVKQVRVMFINFEGEFTDQPLRSRNEYVQLPDGDTRFRFFGRADILDVSPGRGQGGGTGGGGPVGEATKELLQIEAAWQPDTQGKAAIEAKGASVGQPHLLDVCWNTSQTLVWATSSPEITGYAGGDKSKCADGLADMELEPPQVVTPPEGDPDVPEEHPEEG